MNSLSADISLNDIGILLVEDSKVALMQLNDFIKNRAKKVFTAENGKIGLETYIANKDAIDIVISDINMPEMDGLEMTKRIKELDYSTPIILVTAYNDEENLFEAINSGVDQYLTKPVDPTALLKGINKCITLINNKKLLEKERLLTLQNSILNAKSDIMKDIAHHWRNPLHAMCLAAEGINDAVDAAFEESKIEKKLSDRIQKSCDLILAHSLKLSETINTFGSMLSNKGAKERFDIIAAIKISSQLCLNSLDMHNIQILYPDAEHHIIGSKSEFKMCVYNIIKNAAESIAKKGNAFSGLLEIEAEKSEEGIDLFFKDNGIGIENNIFDRICDPYVTSKGVSSGFGNGLFIAKNIIESQFGGTITWQNNATEGSTFRIKLKTE